jgi:hypothetical protein
VAGVDSLHSFQKQAQNIPLGSYSHASRRLNSPNYTFELAPFEVLTLEMTAGGGL